MENMIIGWAKMKKEFNRYRVGEIFPIHSISNKYINNFDEDGDTHTYKFSEVTLADAKEELMPKFTPKRAVIGWGKPPGGGHSLMVYYISTCKIIYYGGTEFHKSPNDTWRDLGWTFSETEDGVFS